MASRGVTSRDMDGIILLRIDVLRIIESVIKAVIKMVDNRDKESRNKDNLIGDHYRESRDKDCIIVIRIIESIIMIRKAVLRMVDNRDTVRGYNDTHNKNNDAHGK